ncbi:MAG: glycosyltransferase family 4 protein [Vicinamibacterales bacterium]
MTKIGILVGEDNWTFFREVRDALARDYALDVFTPRHVRTPIAQARVDRWVNVGRIRRMLQQNDVCVFEWASALLDTASHLPKRAPIVTRLHSFELHAWAPRIEWGAVDRILFVSDAMRRLFVAAHPAEAAKAVVVWNGVDLDRFTPPATRPFAFRLGMLCNLIPVKRVYEAILMVHGLREAGWPARLALGGEPVDEPRYAVALQQLVHRLGLEDVVSFDGRITDAPAWLAQVDIFLSNSFWEGQQVALIEAMASGCYCLSHTWLGAEEVVPDDCLFTTEGEAMSKIAAYASMGDAERRAQGDRLRARAVERFGLARMTAGIRREIESVIR